MSASVAVHMTARSIDDRWLSSTDRMFLWLPTIAALHAMAVVIELLEAD